MVLITIFTSNNIFKKDLYDIGSWGQPDSLLILINIDKDVCMHEIECESVCFEIGFRILLQS